MNTAIRCIILLACITICTSQSIILKCRCVKTSQAVLPARIAHVEVHEPRPYCSKKEIIVFLKDGSSGCLDPNGQFAKLVLQAKETQRVRRADKMRATSRKSSKASASALAKVAATSS